MVPDLPVVDAERLGILVNRGVLLLVPLNGNDYETRRKGWPYKGPQVHVEGFLTRKTFRPLPLRDPFPVQSLVKEKSLPSSMSHVQRRDVVATVKGETEKSSYTPVVGMGLRSEERSEGPLS